MLAGWDRARSTQLCPARVKGGGTPLKCSPLQSLPPGSDGNGAVPTASGQEKINLMRQPGTALRCFLRPCTVLGAPPGPPPGASALVLVLPPQQVVDAALLRVVMGGVDEAGAAEHGNEQQR